MSVSKLVRTLSNTQRTWHKMGMGTAGALSAWLLSTSHAAAAPDSMPVWRVQVRFITADVSDAGTDDRVWIKLNGDNITYIDSGRADRERGRDETYDLRLDGVNTLADLDYFRIEKSGSDGWAIRRMCSSSTTRSSITRASRRHCG